MNNIIDTFKERIKDKRFLILVISLAVMVIACFLPIYKVSLWGISVTENYIYNDGEMADGIFVIIGVIATLVLLVLKKDKFALIPLGVIAIILINLLIKTNDKDLMEYTSIGFYLLYASIIAAGITNTLLALDKENVVAPANNNKVVEAKFEEVKKENTASFGFCPNCGAPKKAADAAFCTACGTKFEK